MIRGLVLCLLSFALCLPAFADPRVGNGGGAWVCEDRASNKIRWIKLVDLFEAEIEFGLALTDTGEAKPWDILAAKLTEIRALSPLLAKSILQTPQELKATIRILPPGAGLTIIDDAMIRVRPEPGSCPSGYLFYGQLANFTRDGRLLINGDFWRDPAFSQRQRGALLVHELIYKALREEWGDDNSSRARQIVGILFANLDSKGERISTILNSSF